MKHAAITLCAALLLSGCAHDAYSVAPNGPGSEAKMGSDLHDCKWDVSQKSFAHSDSDAPMIAGGILFGAIGGAIMGAATAAAHSNNNTSSPPPFYGLVESCMAAKGYNGISE